MFYLHPDNAPATPPRYACKRDTKNLGHGPWLVYGHRPCGKFVMLHKFGEKSDAEEFAKRLSVTLDKIDFSRFTVEQQRDDSGPDPDNLVSRRSYDSHRGYAETKQEVYRFMVRYQRIHGKPVNQTVVREGLRMCDKTFRQVMAILQKEGRVRYIPGYSRNWEAVETAREG